MKNSCAFTGHRPYKLPWKNNENDAACIKLKAELYAQIEKLADQGVVNFLSGMAEGVDTWTAEAVLALREKNPALKLHCILPCKGQEESWPPSAQERYQAILMRADLVAYVKESYQKGCMLERNRYLVDHAARLLAVYNGERRGGTAATVRYARKLGREIIILDPRLPEPAREAE